MKFKLVVAFKRFGEPLLATSTLIIISFEVSLLSDTAHASSGPTRLHAGTKVPCAEAFWEKNPIDSKKTKTQQQNKLSLCLF